MENENFVMNTEGQYGGQIVQELTSMFTGNNPFNEVYKKWGDRLLYMDSHVVPGAFQMNTTCPTTRSTCMILTSWWASWAPTPTISTIWAA